MTPTLPLPRQFLTSLFSTLTTPPPPASHDDQNKTTINEPTNPIHNLPPSHKALLTTLHVLFPPGMLLQAFDLLDRGFVTLVTLTPSSKIDGQVEKEGGRIVQPSRADLHSSSQPTPSNKDTTPPTETAPTSPRRKTELYLVKSSQTPSSNARFRDVYASTGGGKVYQVRVEAWNCSCAAFAFACFPFTPPSLPQNSSTDTRELTSYQDLDEEEEEEGGEEWGEGGRWEFGGLSIDGKEAGKDQGGKEGGVPICKHLLACVLAERWGDVLGDSVRRREVGRDEMGGLGGE